MLSVSSWPSHISNVLDQWVPLQTHRPKIKPFKLKSWFCDYQYEILSSIKATVYITTKELNMLGETILNKTRHSKRKSLFQTQPRSVAAAIIGRAVSAPMNLNVSSGFIMIQLFQVRHCSSPCDHGNNRNQWGKQEADFSLSEFSEGQNRKYTSVKRNGFAATSAQTSVWLFGMGP